MAEGIITRQDLITDDALQFGVEYAKNVQEAIDSNLALKESAKQMFDVYSQLKKVTSEQDFKQAKNDESLAIQKATNAIKEREKAAISAERIKKQALATEKASLDLDVKKAKTVVTLIELEKKQETLKQQQLKTNKEQADLEKKLQTLEIEKSKLKAQNIRNSGLVIDNLTKEEKLTREKLNTIKLENAETKKQTQAVAGQINVWKEQDSLERSLLSTKKKRQLASESTNRALIQEKQALADENKEIKANLTYMGQLTLKRNLAVKAVQEYQAKVAMGKPVSDTEQREIRESVAEFNKYDEAVKRIKNSTNQFQENVGNYPMQFKAIANGIGQLIPILGVVAALRAGVGVMKDAFADIVDTDRQLIAVGKTTNMAGKELEDFGNQAIEMGDKLDGISIKGLLSTAEVAGQLGVKGTKNILTFAEAVEKLKLTSDIISVEQVQNFAQFIEISEDSFENADRLASVMTVLGNNFATTESKVLSNATEIQKAISIYNTSAEGVLGLGAATAALGSEADTSRTAIQKTFKVIDQAIFAGTNLKEVLALTGLTQKELSEQFNKDATGVFVKFVGGLAKAKDEGKNLNKILADVSITETRATTVIGTLAANYDKLSGAVEMASIEYQNNMALNEEVTAAAESIESIIGDISDRWTAYVLRTSEANDVTGKVSKVLKFVRDNLGELIDMFLKYGSVLLTYIGVMKAITLITATYTALKGALAAAELRFALATNIGRTSVLAQATALKSATAAQTGLNIAMSASPWGIVLAALAAVAVAYAVFNDSLSKNEKIQKRINDNLIRKKELLAETAEANRAYTDDVLEQISKEYGLRRSRSGDSVELTKEEIEAKRKVLQNSLEVNAMQIKANDDLLNKTKESSKQKIAMAQEELKALQAVTQAATIYSFISSSGEADEAEKKLSDLKVASANRVNNLRLTNEQMFEENKDLNDRLAKLDDQKKTKEAEAAKEAEEETKRQREKRLKDAEEFRKTLISDKYNYRAAELKYNIDAEKLILNNDKNTVGQRLLANKSFVDESIKLLEFEKATAISKSKGRADEILRINLKYKEDFESLIREQEANAEKILESSFNKTKKRLADQNALEQKAQDDRITAEQKKLNVDLGEASTNSERLRLIKEFEERVTAIKKENTEARLANSIKAIQAELNSPMLNPEQRLALEQLLSDAQISLSDEVTENAIENVDKQAQAAFRLQEIKNNLISNAANNIAESLDLDASHIEGLLDSFLNKAELTGDAVIDKFNEVSRTMAQIGSTVAVVGDVFSSIFGANIERIDEQIEKSQEYYENQISLAKGDQEQQDLLRQESEAKRLILEDKKKKEQIKAAEFAKAFAIFNIGITTAQAMIAALAPPPIGLGPVLGIPLAGLAAGLGLLQVAAVIAKPIPKYQYGTDYHPGGPAEVSEVRPEIIHEPGKQPYIQRKRAVLDLARGTKVYPNLNKWEQLKFENLMGSFDIQGSKLQEFDKNIFVEMDNSEVVKELYLTRKEIQKNRPLKKQRPQDLNHELFRYKNTNWNN